VTLDELGIQYGTDKGPRNHNYLRYYALHFEPRRYQPINLLELGISTGASLRMWRDYFPKGRITGLDIDPNTCFTGERIKCYAGVQDDPEMLLQMHRESGPFDFIIDDASHDGNAQYQSFQILYPLLAPGGIYVVEDLQTNYLWETRSFVNDVIKTSVDKILFAGKSGIGDPRNEVNFAAQLLENMDDFEKQTESLAVYQGMAFFFKRREYYAGL
jgi:trans-aconitate methyltransferase